MKANNSKGGLFLRKWQGEPPQGRESTPFRYQKGQPDEARINKFERTYDPSQGWIKKWRF